MQRSNDRFAERLPLVLHRPWLAYLFTTLLCVGAVALRLTAMTILPIGYPFVSFFPAVILAAFLFGVRPGIYAAILCGLLSWYLFISPDRSFAFNPAVALALCFYAGVVGIDIALIHLMQRANFNLAIERERSRALAENRELLFHELQHRVSNNLQVVAALLSLQRRNIDDEHARKALDEASARLALVGKISRALYDPAGPGQALRAFLAMLADDILAASGRSDIRLSIEAPDELVLEPHVMVPVALIVTEAMSNAIEHGFAARGGAIGLSVSHEGKDLALRLADDGHGLPDGFDLGGSESLGLRIARALAAQFGGHFRLDRRAEGGTIACLTMTATPAGTPAAF